MCGERGTSSRFRALSATALVADDISNRRHSRWSLPYISYTYSSGWKGGFVSNLHRYLMNDPANYRSDRSVLRHRVCAATWPAAGRYTALDILVVLIQSSSTPEPPSLHYRRQSNLNGRRGINAATSSRRNKRNGFLPWSARRRAMDLLAKSNAVMTKARPIRLTKLTDRV